MKMAHRKQRYISIEPDDKRFSMDEAWAKAREIMGRFDGEKLRSVAGYLNAKENCIEVRVTFRSADITDKLDELIKGTEYFTGITEKVDVMEFPYAVYKVPYRPEYSWLYR